MSAEPNHSVPLIKQLKLERFRGIKSLTWLPVPGLNVILGGGDVGKSTILEAIGLLLNPTNGTTVSDADYWRREISTEFSIEAVISFPSSIPVNQQSKMMWPWEWDGEKACVPQDDDQQSSSVPRGSPVYRLRVRGTSDLELVYEMIQPDETLDPFGVGLRRAIGVVRLAGDDRNDRDLRLVQGSALDRVLSDKGLRARLGRELGTKDIDTRLVDGAKEALTKLDTEFQQKALPSKLGLGLTGSPGLSITALLGLTADKGGIKLPLTNWGAGTRRLASLAVATSLQVGRPITLVDEIERGLEPYRQRTLVKYLQESGAQVFITTHSAAALSAASNAAIWYLDASSTIAQLPNKKIEHQRGRDAEAFLAKFTIVGEGITEVGFAAHLLEKSIEGSFVEHGIWLTDGGGHEASLQLLEALGIGGLKFGGIVDDEGKSPERWRKVQDKLGALLLRWKNGCLEEVLLSHIDETKLEGFITDPNGELTGQRLRTLADRLTLQDKDFQSIKTAAGTRLKQIIFEAATGKIPADKETTSKDIKKQLVAHERNWFKSEAGGRELAVKMFSLGIWSQLEAQILPFLNAVRDVIGKKPISTVPP